MRLLTLIRHAKAGLQGAGLGDMERPLDDSGRADAHMMGRRLAAVGCRPALFVSSPAERARRTAEAIALAVGYPETEIEFAPELYGAGVRELLEVARGVAHHLEHALLVAHNPGITDFLACLCDSSLRSMPPCGIARLELDITSWTEVGPGCGREIDFDYPMREAL